MSIEERSPLIGPYAITKLVRSAFVIGLRNSFKDNPRYTFIENPDHSTDIDKTAIEITDVHPLEVLKWPAIIVSGVIDRGGTFFFDNDLINVNYDTNGNPVSEERGNVVRLTITIDVWALSSVERDEILDDTYIYLRTLRTKFAELGIENREVTLTGPREEKLGQRMLFIAGISINTYSEWIIKQNIDPNDVIKSFRTIIEK